MANTDFNQLAGAGAINRSALIQALEQRGIYVIEDGEDPQDLTPGFATHLAFEGVVFWYDPDDATTPHDGATCLVTADGKRFKSDALAGAQRRHWLVQDKDLTAPPGGPTVGHCYIVAVGGSGAWAGEDKHIAVYTARGWRFIVPASYDIATVSDEALIYHYSAGGSWTSGIGALTIGANSIYPSAIKYGRFGHWVINQTTDAPPGSPADGDAYVIGPAPTGAWATHARKIAIYETSDWQIYTPVEGAVVFDRSSDTLFYYSGAAWVSVSSGYSQVNDVFTAAAAAMTAGSSVTTANDYAYSATSAPTTGNPSSLDAVTLDHAAKAAGKVLEIEYQGVYEGGISGANVTAVFAALQIDSSATMSDWVHLGAAPASLINLSFRVTASDALSHTYSVRFFYTVSGSTTPAPVIGRRHLKIRERA